MSESIDTLTWDEFAFKADHVFTLMGSDVRIFRDYQPDDFQGAVNSFISNNNEDTNSRFWFLWHILFPDDKSFCQPYICTELEAWYWARMHPEDKNQMLPFIQSVDLMFKWVARFPEDKLEFFGKLKSFMDLTKWAQNYPEDVDACWKVIDFFKLAPIEGIGFIGGLNEEQLRTILLAVGWWLKVKSKTTEKDNETKSRSGEVGIKSPTYFIQDYVYKRQGVTSWLT